jgi:DNA polymerase-2
MAELSGWLLDLYAGHQGRLVLWLLGDDGTRYRLQQGFPVTFYAAGEHARLRDLWRCLEAQPVPVRLSRTERRELFQPKPIPLLGVEVQSPAAQPRLFQQVVRKHPDLTYFDADIQLSLRHAAVHDTFPLARCRITTDNNLFIHRIQVLDSPWDLDPPEPPLRVLRLRPDRDPSQEQPQYLLAKFDRHTYDLPFQPARPLLISLASILRRHDPDLLLTIWGDTWLLPHLLRESRRHGIALPLNRDPGFGVAHRPEKTYFSYGQVIYRGQQVHLFGRWHLDGRNVMLWDDYDLSGVLEAARVTTLPVQTSARSSPGTGISSMQLLTALRMRVLVPWHKQQAERPKSALDMFSADQGGMVYQPLVGLHHDVAGIDFASMYPGIMVQFNISPETAGDMKPDPGSMRPFLSPGREGRPGLVPQTLAPLLTKRLAFKQRMQQMEPWNPKRASFKARSSALKWLLVTCFGYLGYKNARFGRIEAHEAVTSYGREALLRAKDIAEDLGFTVLHMYVDGMWVKKPGAKKQSDFQSLVSAIAQQTSIPVAMDGVYPWIIFLPSRLDARVPVPNRYFGVFDDGTLKIRGIDIRRHDTPYFITRTQMEILNLLSDCAAEELPGCLQQAIELVRGKLRDLQRGRIPLESMLVDQKLSRELDEYRIPSPSARAAAQLQDAGKNPRAGQHVRFLYTLGYPGVRAWDLPDPPDPRSLDLAYYRELMLRAARSVLEPFGIDETELHERVAGYRQLAAGPLINSGGKGNYSVCDLGSTLDPIGQPVIQMPPIPALEPARVDLLRLFPG